MQGMTILHKLIARKEQKNQSPLVNKEPRNLKKSKEGIQKCLKVGNGREGKNDVIVLLQFQKEKEKNDRSIKTF